MYIPTLTTFHDVADFLAGHIRTFSVAIIGAMEKKRTT